jgi:ubiquinone/menaquinone biosynthesis C-methylase UbiE
MKKSDKKNVGGNDGGSWGSVASWYDRLLETGGNNYQSTLILPNLIRLLGPKRGEVILDLASGQGFFTREIAKTGADIFGVDIGKELVAIAKRRSPGIKFYVSSADNLSFIKNQTVDKIIIVLAFQDIANVGGVLAEAGRVIKPSGRLIVVLNHPTFRIPKRSSWGFDDLKKIQYRRVDQYMSEVRAPIEVHPGTAESAKTVYFHRPLQFYFKALAKSGFVVSRLEEWVSDRKSESGPRQAAENKARREIPLFLAIEAVKFGR